MAVEQFEEFLELARCLNYTEAAENLHMTQPALSKHIAALEKEFDAPLFQRDKRSVRITQAGRVLAGASTQIVDAYRKAKDDIALLNKRKIVRIDGIIYDPIITSIMGVASAIGTQLNNLSFINEHNGSADLFETLENGDIDIAISYRPKEELEQRGLDFLPLSRSHFVAIVDKSNPIAARESITMDDLKDQRLIALIDTYSKSGWVRIEEVCHAHGFEPKKRPELVSETSEYTLAIPLNGDVLINQSNLRQLKYLENIGTSRVVPITDDDAFFLLCAIWKKSDTERLAPAVDALTKARDIVLRLPQGAA